MADELKLPELAPQSYADIFTALRDGIAAYSSNWTDYNPSDPGITLLQLFAWIANGTYYRIDRVSDEAYRNYLLIAVGTPEQGVPAALRKAGGDVVRRDGKRLLLGAAPVPLDPTYIALLEYVSSIAGQRVPAAELHEVALRFWKSRYRAITAEDFEALAVECTAAVPAEYAQEKVARAFAANHDGLIEVSIVSGYRPRYAPPRRQPAPADRGVLAVDRRILSPPGRAVLHGYEKLVYAVSAYLAPRRLIGTPLHVRRVRYTLMIAAVDLVVGAGFDPAAVCDQVSATITRLVDPVTGGPSGDGYPYGQALTGGDLVMAVRSLAGVDPSQPVNAAVRVRSGLPVGAATLGLDTVVVAPGAAFELPMLLALTIRAMRSTWTIEVGVHGVIGLDTRLPPQESA